MNLKQALFLPILILGIAACQNKPQIKSAVADHRKNDSLARIQKEKEIEQQRDLTTADISLTIDLSYDKHSLAESYPYKDTTRSFQLEKIKAKLAEVENFEKIPGIYAILQNYKNRNREAAVVKKFKRNAYTRVSDSLGTERYQSAPLYALGETDDPTLYGRDGSLVHLQSSDTLKMVKIQGISFEGTWEVPKRYVKTLGASDSISFERIAFVDVSNQNICTVEKISKGKWVIRSMNPATTGVHRPPHAQETPTGIFVLQEHKTKMFYMKDGTSSIEGYAPYASRFTNGAYIHGIPVNNVKAKIIEYSSTLGTIPRSHMCVRNASSHAKHIFEWAKPLRSLVIIID